MLILLLNSCSVIETELYSPLMDSPLKEQGDNSQRRTFDIITFHPQKGKYFANGISAEYIPQNKQILLISTYRIRLVHSTIQIVEAPHCGWVNQIQSCNFYYTITVDDAFVNCLSNTDYQIQIGFYY